MRAPHFSRLPWAIKHLAEIIKRRSAKRASLTGMKSKTRKPGYRDSVGALLVAPDLNGLYGEARVLRDTILRRLAAIGYKIDEKSLPEARAIVSSTIGALVVAPEFEILLGYSRGEARMITLLVQSCAAEIAANIRPPADKRRKARIQRATPLRLVADNEKLR
jgi:hypothetical protein